MTGKGTTPTENTRILTTFLKPHGVGKHQNLFISSSPADLQGHLGYNCEIHFIHLDGPIGSSTLTDMGTPSKISTLLTSEGRIKARLLWKFQSTSRLQE